MAKDWIFNKKIPQERLRQEGKVILTHSFFPLKHLKITNLKIYMQVRKQQLELDMEQQTGSK